MTVNGCAAARTTVITGSENGGNYTVDVRAE